MSWLTCPVPTPEGRTHLFGSHLFIDAGMTEGPSGLHRASALVAFRQEIYTAFMTQRPVKLAFCPSGISRSLDDQADECTWTNRILIALAEGLNLCYGPDDDHGGYRDLCAYADAWFHKKPPSFEPICVTPANDLYSSTWVISDTVASGLANYHLLRLLLISFDPSVARVGPDRSRDVKRQDEDIRREVWEVVGLARGNEKCAPLSAWAGLAIYMAGDRFCDQAEQRVLMDFLTEAEKVHAWNTTATQRYLARVWA